MKRSIITTFAALHMLHAALTFGGPREQVDVAEAIVWAAQHSRPVLPADRFDDVPMRLEFKSPVQANAASRLEVIAYTGEAVHGEGWCRNCPFYKKSYGDGDDRIAVKWSKSVAPGPQIYPAIRFVDAKGVEKYPSLDGVNYYAPQTLGCLISIIDEHNGTNSYGATGSAGALHARKQIEEAISLWKERIGVTKPDGSPVIVTFVWRRTGGQTFPLLHQQPQQWNCANIFGSLGEFSIEAPGSNLPVQPLLLGYRRANGKMLLRGEISIDESMLGLPGDVAEQTGYSAEGPSGIGPMALLTIVTVIRDIFAILNPTCDLTLGGTVSATAFYDESANAIRVKFQDMPAIKLVVLWQFDLGVKSLDISPSNVHAEFNGSRVIKSRDVAVE